jgi:hypothetical protein
MEKNSKYILVILEERNGEYEYVHKFVTEIKDKRKRTAKKVAEDYAKNSYDISKRIKAEDGYYFNRGEVFVRLYSWHFLNEEEYNIFRKYI